MIPDIKELNFPKKDGKQYATLTQATAKADDMGEKTITTQVKIDGEEYTIVNQSDILATLE